ncbi:hypothetical protein [Arachidicoccus ginsenosidimutans]
MNSRFGIANPEQRREQQAHHDQLLIYGSCPHEPRHLMLKQLQHDEQSV